jgi:uncharacterized protein (TIGR02145 family)
MRLTLTTLYLLMSMMLFALAPAFVPYQAIARTAAGDPLASSFTLHDVNATCASVWQELQTVTTSSLGLFTVQLGSNVSLATVNCALGAKCMQVDNDLGNGFVYKGTQQPMSVLYALHSESALSAGDGISNVLLTGDTLFFNNGGFVIIPGISAADNNGGTTTGTSLHTCGAPNVHNPNLTCGSMTDQEGNVYKTIVIGTQEWMAENLNTSIYRNGDAIPTILDNVAWQITTSGAWAYYNNDGSNASPYGKLYNWYTCVDARQLCPVGWHVPTEAEWSVLTNYLGKGVAGGKMKTTGTIEAATGLWFSPNTGATNSSGFSGVPGGGRANYGKYDGICSGGYWWSSSENGSSLARLCNLNSSNGVADLGSSLKHFGFSVRCLRD